LDFAIPDDIQKKLAELDRFIEAEIAPLEREHLAAKGLSLYNELHSESSIVGNFPVAQILEYLDTSRFSGALS
jgi:hypothetical protein